MRYHQTDKGSHKQNISCLKKVQDKYDYSRIPFPVMYEDIETFEENIKVCIYVYGIDEDNKIITEKAGNTKYILNECIYLLVIEEEEQSHCVYIKI